MGHMSLLAICALGAVVPSVVHAFRLPSKTVDWGSLWSQLVPTPCPSNSFMQNTEEDKDLTCICEEGYEAVLPGTNQRLRSMELEFVGTKEQRWMGECRKCGCSATEDKGYAYLLFEGGGVRGIAYGGVVKALEEAHLLEHVEGFSGTSAGSQVAAFLAAGYSGAEIIEELIHVDFNSLADTNSGVLGITSKFGYYKGDALENMIDTLIKKKTGIEGTTFAQLREYSCAKGSCKELRLPALNVNTGRLTWFNAQTTPGVSVAKAVRASSAIPLFYQPASIKMPDGETYLFVDGGTLRNLPHDAFDVTPDKPALGLSLRDNGVIGIQKKTKFEDLPEYLLQMYNAILFGPNSANSLEIGSHAVDIRAINSDDVGVTDFDIDQMTKSDLISKGHNAVFKQLEICRSNGKLMQHTVEASPIWLARMHSLSAQEAMAAQIANGISNGGTSHWWNMKRTKAAFNKYLVYTGEVQKTGEVFKTFSPRSIEVLRIEDNVYIVTHMSKGAGAAAQSLIRDIYIVYGKKDTSLPFAKESASGVCLEFLLHKVVDMRFDSWRKMWMHHGNSTPVSLEFCGSEDFSGTVMKSLTDSIISNR